MSPSKKEIDAIYKRVHDVYMGATAGSYERKKRVIGDRALNVYYGIIGAFNIESDWLKKEFYKDIGKLLDDKSDSDMYVPSSQTMANWLIKHGVPA